MGSKQSTANSPSRIVSRGENSSTIGGSFSSSTPFRSGSHAAEATEQLNNGRDTNWRQRARSLTAVISSDSRPSHSSAIDVLSPFGMSPSSDILSVSSNDDHLSASYGYTAHSLPVHFFPINGFKCPFCSKTILPDDVECHLVMCITKPQLNYNEDILRDDKEECVICLEEMLKGNKIARLPCLCIYHKQCIDAWFEVNRSCPEHPAD
ncbi:PREDICTED: E3 ubiquitin-protein ligase ZNRF2-like [Rhagoletis zephyria]|uniref:E3 ubiquitin-protein ligase ZNRF2-like n=1 Tax=Rhagoletis zephyria TaxID=28612 RepID=UPI0008114144|nr:PREDICTED: E3 ubiquitin-protein ligase ZNRF2-like [Rhagoletis zephyria]